MDLSGFNAMPSDVNYESLKSNEERLLYDLNDIDVDAAMSARRLRSDVKY